MTIEPDKLLCRLAGQMDEIEWLPLNVPMRGKALNNALVFASELPKSGLPFQCRTREDRAGLEDLRERGLVDARGQTSGIKVRLTASGAACIWDLQAAVEDLAAIAALPTVCMPGGGMSVVMGYELIEGAGEWWGEARKSTTTWKTYNAAMTTAWAALTPLFIMGWLGQFCSIDQAVWAVKPTVAGFAAMTEPQPTVPDGFEYDAEADRQGREEARARFSRNPPDSGNYLAYPLPASKWNERT